VHRDRRRARQTVLISNRLRFSWNTRYNEGSKNGQSSRQLNKQENAQVAASR